MGEGIDFQVNYEDETIVVPVILVKIQQVILNLLTNAVDAMSESSTKTLTVDVRTDMDELKISVTDTGKGLSKSVQDKMFDPFFTTKSVGKGTGLGLAVVKSIVEQHNGSVRVLSTEGPQ